MLGKGLDALIPPPPPDSSNPSQGGAPIPDPVNVSVKEEKEELLPSPPEELELPAPAAIVEEKTQEKKEEVVTATVSEAPDPVPLKTAPVNTPPPATVFSSMKEADRDALMKRTAVGEAVFLVEVDKIKPNPHQPRRSFNEENLKELAASIREHGILQPLVVTKLEKDVPSGTEVEYQLIAGERRLMAAKLLGLERVPVIVRHASTSPNESLEMAVIENLQRQDLNSIEMARAFAKLQDEFRMTQREIATRLGKSRETVANTLRLLDLPHHMQEAIVKGQITESHGRLLLTIKDPALQERLFQDLLENSITTRELHQRVKSENRKNQEPIKHVISPEIMMLEEKLTSVFGAPVKINQDGETGKITINYYSKEELQNIISHLKSDLGME